MAKNTTSLTRLPKVAPMVKVAGLAIALTGCGSTSQSHPLCNPDCPPMPPPREDAINEVETPPPMAAPPMQAPMPDPAGERYLEEEPAPMPPPPESGEAVDPPMVPPDAHHGEPVAPMPEDLANTPDG